MKLQKLVYCTHGWWLAINNSSMLNERPQVWKHGPVFRSLYHTLKTYGHAPITRPQLRQPEEKPQLVGPESNLAHSYLDFVWDRYGHLSSFALSAMTHDGRGAWRRLASEYRFEVPFDLEIPDDYVRDEFLALYEEEKAKSGDTSTTWLCRGIGRNWCSGISGGPRLSLQAARSMH